MQAGQDWRDRSRRTRMKLPAAHQGGISISLMFGQVSQKTFALSGFCRMFSSWNM